jgi:trimeric autotransporter adhesin
MPYIGVSPSNGVRRKHTYTATASQTSFSGAGAEGATLSYNDSNFVDVYQNGVKLSEADYTSTSGTAIVLAQGASADDIVEVVVFDVFSVADTVSKADGGTFDGNVTMGGTLGVTGNQTNSGNVTITGDLASSTSGTSNFKAGVNAGNSIASGGNYNVCVGDEAGTAISTGDNNTALGYSAGASITTTSNCTVVGRDAGGDITTGTQNTIVGSNAGNAITEGQYNVAMGVDALGADTLGSKSVAIGVDALNIQNFTSATDSHNTAVGYNAGKRTTTAIKNVIMGSLAGDEITDGQQNVCIGYNNSANLTTGDFNVCIGSINKPTSANGEFCIILGYNVDGANNYTTIGKSSSDIRALHGSTTWSTVSDERYKKDITDSTAGLGFINDLRPRTFKYKNLGDLPDTFNSYEEGSTEVFKNANTNHGFIAQEVKTAIDAHSEIKDGFRLWDDRDDGSQEVAEAALIPILTKAVQELSAQVTALTNRITALENGE